MKKKIFKRAVLSAVCCALVLPTMGLNQVKTAKAEAKSYVIRDYSEYSQSANFMVGGYFAPDLTNDSEVETLINSGLDFICLNGNNTVTNWSGLVDIFEKFDQNGMKLMLDANKGSNPDAMGYWVDALGTYVSGWNRDCVIGTDFWDEPSTTAEINQIASYIEGFETAFPNKLFFANLLPAYFWSDDTFKQEHVDYLEYYADTVLDNISGQKMLSIDSYPLSKEYNGTKTYLRQTFLSDLATTAIVAKQHGADVSFYAQTMNPAQKSTNKPSFRNLEGQADLDMQYSIFMAFGAKQIINFCYETPDYSGDQAFLSDAMVTPEGTPTNNYYYVQNKVAEIDAMDEAYMNFDWNGVIISQGTTYDRFRTSNNNNKDCYGQLTNGLFANEVAYASAYNTSSTKQSYLTNGNLASVTSSETTFVGCFEDDMGYNGYYLANTNDTTRSNASSVSMTFDSNTQKVRVYRGTSYTDEMLSGNTLTLSMKSGEGIFVVPFKTVDGCSITLNVNGSSQETIVAEGASYVLPTATADKGVFLGWEYNGKVYPAGYTINQVNDSITLNAVTLDLTMVMGASIRIISDHENSIRWTAEIVKDSLTALENLVGASSISYGLTVVSSEKEGSLTIAIPRNRFGQRTTGGKAVWTLSGVMSKVPEQMLNAQFEARVFVKITYADGSSKKIYANGNDNVRSIAYVAYCAYNDVEGGYTDEQLERLRILSIPYVNNQDNEGSLNDWIGREDDDNIGSLEDWLVTVG